MEPWLEEQKNRGDHQLPPPLLPSPLLPLFSSPLLSFTLS